ncbi:MAG: hypothetical protein QOF48_1173 [Verrucomicrobiota bacterium]
MMIIGIALLTYLTLAKNQNQLVMRSQTWNACLPMAEAGIDEALNHLVWNATNMTASGWTKSGTNSYYRTNALGDGYYAVTISTNLTPASIIATGYIPMPGSTTFVARKIKVEAAMIPPYSFAMRVKNSVSMNGNGCVIDSYDSSDPTKSTGGLYDAAKAGDEADVSCISQSGNVNLGNGNIWGHAFVAPGGKVTTGPNGAVGSKTWNQTKSGVQPGWSKSDANLSIPDAKVPFTGGVPPLPGLVGGVIYTAVLDGGIFQMATMTGKVIVTDDSLVYVTGSIDVTKFVIQTNATVRIYCGGPSADLGTQVNGPKLASACMFFGLPTCTSIDISSDWIGTVYAPSADFGAAGGADFYGSCTAKSLTLKGHSAYHFDAALKKPQTTDPGFVITSWIEL